LVEHALSVPGHVGRTLAVAGGGVEIGAGGAGRLGAAQQVALVGLADDNVGRRQIGENRRTRERGSGGGRVGGPEVLADLDRQPETGKLLRGEDQVDTERNLGRADADVLADYV